MTQIPRAGLKTRNEGCNKALIGGGGAGRATE
jgi:hypothetical protein